MRFKKEKFSFRKLPNNSRQNAIVNEDISVHTECISSRKTRDWETDLEVTMRSKSIAVWAGLSWYAEANSIQNRQVIILPLKY
jgi:hypothetical protein